MLSNLIQIFELATIVLLFLCVARELKKQPYNAQEAKPKKIFKKPKLTKEEKKAQKRLQTLIDNIDNYAGDGIGQKEVK